MSLHKLSAGGGVDYLLRHTCCGDIERAAETPLSSYYVESGYPPGRWMGRGLAGVADGRGISGPVGEEGMNRLFGLGMDPVTGVPLGAAWRATKPTAQRIVERVAAAPTDLCVAERDDATRRIEAEENARRTPVAVSGFDLTFTLPKSASIVWALADPATQAQIAKAHNEAVADCLALIQQHALFTRVGKNGIAQVPTRGALAAGFDHWDTRTGDPNLHTHLVIANKVQGLDGVWRSIDAKGLYAATVAISETYDTLVADKIAATIGAGWSVRARDQRSALFEIDGVSPDLLAEFSHRSLQVEAQLRGLLADFHARNNRSPSRAEMLRIRQHATRISRPVKQSRPLSELLTRWRERAAALLPSPIEDWVACVTRRRQTALRVGDLDDEQLLQLAKTAVGAVVERRSTWTRWNLLAEAARATKTLRMASTSDRIQLLERVAEIAVDRFCLPLGPPDLTPAPQAFRRPDGSDAFRRHRAEVYTSPVVLDAEDRLLAATRDLSAARAAIGGELPAVQARDGNQVALSADQAAAVTAIAASGRRLDVLVGPAGSGKTTTMRALKTLWEREYGPGSVIGLAPSAAAARELAHALRIGCENTAKWIHETTGPAAQRRRDILDQLRTRREHAIAAGDIERVADIDRRGNAIAASQRRFRLRENQLLIVDEASLAGTLTLDQLARQADAAGAKVLLVGDHRQLSAVDAGGAFGLLATDTGAAELSSLWRFTHRWECLATQQLRMGDTTAIDTYTAHDRLREGPAEVMASDAYRAWVAAIRNGKRALLIAADNATVAALNDQARADRFIAGEVEAGGALLHDGTTAGVGDIVITRANNRAVRTSSGAWVRNGDLWTVTARGHDGSLTMRRNREHAAGSARDSVVTLDPDYVGAHVELGYATTAHRAQGMTVDAAFALLRPGMAREVAYVAMTRGREENVAFIATDIPDPAYDGAPEPPTTGRQILEQILTTQGAQLSATQTLRQLHHDAESLATLGAIHETLVQATGKARWAELIAATFDADTTAAIIASPAYGPLVAVLRRAEYDGVDVACVLPALAVASLLSRSNNGSQAGDAEEVRDPAAVLRWRVETWHAAAERSAAGRRGPLLAGIYTPAGPAAENADSELAKAIADIEARIAARASAVMSRLIDERPVWLRRLGAEPTNPRAKGAWRAAVKAIAVYRDAYNVAGTMHPLGPEPPTDHAQRRARRRALAMAAGVARNAGRVASAQTASRMYEPVERTPTP